MALLWLELQKILKEKVGELHYNTWFKDAKFHSYEDDCLTLEVPNKFMRDWLNDNFQATLEQELTKVSQKPSSVRFRVPEGATLTAQKEALPLEALPPMEEAPVTAPAKPAFKVPHPQKRIIRHESLNPRYSFDRFVVGSDNQFAHAACMAVASKPAQTYNPLFIFGGVGLGKTHLLCSIGLEVLRRNPDARIIYTSTERFMNEFIHAVRFQRMGEFRRKYRNSCDVLLMDDIQFISGKEQTQEEFFHTFNFLHESRKQIVVTSDKFPKEIQNLEERLCSRFQWGLIADIQPPNLETRMAILKKKADEEAIQLSDEVVLFLASSIHSNVRALEGALTRVSAFASLAGLPLTLDLAKDVLKNIVDDSTRILTLDRIKKVVSDYYNIKLSDLIGKKRIKGFTVPRQVAMYLCRKHMHASFPEIGQGFGGKDHSTVIHAFNKIEDKISLDPTLKSDISSLEKRLSVSK